MCRKGIDEVDQVALVGEREGVGTLGTADIKNHSRGWWQEAGEEFAGPFGLQAAPGGQSVALNALQVVGCDVRLELHAPSSPESPAICIAVHIGWVTAPNAAGSAMDTAQKHQVGFTGSGCHELDGDTVRIAQLQRRVTVLQDHPRMVDTDLGKVFGPAVQRDGVRYGESQMVQGDAGWFR